MKNNIKKKYVGIFGKSTVPAESQEYILTEEVTRCVLGKGYGVIHGGYAGGIMQAVADTAALYCKENVIPAINNLAVPQYEHESVGWTRVADAYFAPVAPSLYARLEYMLSRMDFAIVAPLGGDGTFAEVITVYHQNVIAKYTGGKIIPLIFMQTPGGTNWKKIMNTVVAGLDTKEKAVGEIPWMHFVENVEEVRGIVG